MATNLEASDNPLPSWNDTETRDAIVGFVESVTGGGPNHISSEERVAVFDNDGTLWCEEPMPIQLDFLVRRMGEMASRNPALLDQQPWKAVAAKDYGWLSGALTKHYGGDDSDLKVLVSGLFRAYEGSTIEEFEAMARAFMHGVRHPTLDRRYLDCVYQPMVELLNYLASRGFTSYIASGGGRDFMRAVSQELYDIPPERVMGSSAALEYREVGDVAQIVHTAKPDILDDGPAKPVRIWSRTGRRPILAAGNANGDIPMLHFAFHPSRPSLSLLVHHDDGVREFAYDDGAEKALERAKARGWTVVSMKNDWASLFVDGRKAGGRVSSG
jgi:phosphoglycolate phosphatase-like HAD superfamily hydrolase